MSKLIDEVKENFIEICKLAMCEIFSYEIEVEILEAGISSHIPTKLPEGKMAVYVFMDKDFLKCFKIGKAGANSNARYQSQHYNPNSANSNLALSILDDYEYNNLNEVQRNVGEWIKCNMTRINFLVNSEKGILILNMLEAFLQLRLNPKYEGHRNQRI